jgi:CheY-like chemotaxis protein
MSMKTKGKILVVDDELPVCQSIASALETEGYQVDTVQSGEEALERGRQDGYDMLLVDLMMPGMSGMEVLEAIKNGPSEPVVIMITGYPTMKTAVQAVKLGAFDYLPKPFTPKELRVLVARGLGRRRLIEQQAVAGQGPTRPDISITEDIYCIPGHSWARVEPDGKVRIGVHETFLISLRQLTSVEFPYEGERVSQGEACLWLTDKQSNLHRVWAPVSGQVVAIHQELKADPSHIVQDPYGSGWLLLLEPDRLEEELENLVPFGYK